MFVLRFLTFSIFYLPFALLLQWFLDRGGKIDFGGAFILAVIAAFITSIVAYNKNKE